MKIQLNNINLPTLNLQQARAQLEIFLNLQQPVFMHGPVGLGKSSLINQIAEKTNRNVIDLRMGQLDISDLRGIPYYNKTTNKMEWASPVCLPSDPDDNSILFLDEFNCANPSVQASAYQLILDRKVGDYKLPAKVSVVAAGNRDKDFGVTFKIASPLLNRFVHLNLDYDVPTWLEWASAEKDFNQKVIDYIRVFPDDLFIKEWNPSFKSFVSPRSWHFVSNLLNNLENGDHTKDVTFVQNIIASCIGESIALKFVDYVITKGAPSHNFEEILFSKQDRWGVFDVENEAMLDVIKKKLATPEYKVWESLIHNDKTTISEYISIFNIGLRYIERKKQGGADVKSINIALDKLFVLIKALLKLRAVIHNTGLIHSDILMSFITSIKSQTSITVDTTIAINIDKFLESSL